MPGIIKCSLVDGFYVTHLMMMVKYFKLWIISFFFTESKEPDYDYQRVGGTGKCIEHLGSI